MAPILHIIYMVIQIMFMIFLGSSVLYIFIFSFAGLFYRQKPYPQNPVLRKIVVLIPCYKEDIVIREVAKDALFQDYPKEKFDVIVIADSFQKDTLDFLNSMPVKVIEVKFDTSTKTKSLNKAMEQLTDKYDIVVILDADNLMAKDFLSKINAAFESGFIAIQGHRTAKNMNTSLAILDAVSEEINNHIFRRGHRAVGLSSAIIGSGMAFEYDFFKNLMSTVKAIGGFDKEIELKLLKEGYTIEYLEDAYVYDEKVQRAEAFANQRRRWLSAQYLYLSTDIFPSFKAMITKGNIEYFNKAFQFAQPPRILLLGLVMFLTMFYSLLNYILEISSIYSYIWIGIFVICIFSFVCAVPRKMYTWKTLFALTSLLNGLRLMIGSLIRIKGANRHFIHTKHGESQ
jgi:cellulose synthase/poly-beta-1,6-N-acetylglucosamine synthase-like glycosyltransferase